MGKPKNPNEVDKKSFSDSLELFDSLFQEELEVKTNKQAPPQKSPPQQSPHAKKIAVKKSEQASSITDEEQSDGLVSIAQLKKGTTSTEPPLKEATEIDHKKEPPVSKGKSAAAKKPLSEKKRDTLKMKTESAQPPPSEPEQTEDETAQESGFGPIGMIRLAQRDEEGPLPASASPEKIGKLYTPKESKKLIPNLSIKESNLYKVVLSGFVVAIIVMVLVNFFGLIGSKEPRKPSAQIKRSASQKAAPKKRSREAAKKPKTTASVQKKSTQKSSSSNKAKTVKKPRAKKPPAPKTVAASTPQPRPKTVYPDRRRNAPSLKPPPNVVASTESTSKAIEKAQQERDIPKGIPESVTPTPPETNTIQVSSAPPASSIPRPTAEIANSAPIEEAPSYPYSVYLGAYKTLKRARAAVSQYRAMGVSSYWVKVDLGHKGIWHRLFTGHFEDGEAALDFINERDLEEASVKKTRYTTLIGDYSSDDEIIKMSEKLDKLGYSSYVVDGGNGTSHLYSGAFITKSGAEKQYQELATKGIRNRVVER